jgi:hypothetical protein
MTKVIFKYPLMQGLGLQPLQIELGAKIIHVGFQNEQLYLWAEVDMNVIQETIDIFIQGTGQNLYEFQTLDLSFIGTAVGNPFVWHVYKVIK